MVTLDELKGLSPEAKIKKLKELEEERRKAIEQAEDQIKAAQKELKEAEEELDHQREVVEQIPVPEVGGGSIEELFEGEEAPKEGVETAAQPEAPDQAYIQQLSQTPIEELDNRIDYLRDVQQEFGQLNQDQYQEARNLGYALDRKQEDAKSGKYNPSDAVKEEIYSDKQWLDNLLGTYKQTYR